MSIKPSRITCCIVWEGRIALMPEFFPSSLISFLRDHPDCIFVLAELPQPRLLSVAIKFAERSRFLLQVKAELITAGLRLRHKHPKLFQDTSLKIITFDDELEASSYHEPRYPWATQAQGETDREGESCEN